MSPNGKKQLHDNLVDHLKDTIGQDIDADKLETEVEMTLDVVLPAWVAKGEEVGNAELCSFIFDY